MKQLSMCEGNLFKEQISMQIELLVITRYIEVKVCERPGQVFAVVKCN